MDTNVNRGMAGTTLLWQTTLSSFQYLPPGKCLFCSQIFPSKTTATLVVITVGYYIILTLKLPESFKVTAPRVTKFEHRNVFRVSREIIQHMISGGKNNKLWERVSAKIIIALCFYLKNTKFMTYHFEVSYLSEAISERLRHGSKFSGDGPLFCMACDK